MVILPLRNRDYKGDNMKTYQPYEIGKRTKKERIKIAKMLQKAFDQM